MGYYEKYLKYKQKYLSLRNKMVGGELKINDMQINSVQELLDKIRTDGLTFDTSPQEIKDWVSSLPQEDIKEYTRNYINKTFEKESEMYNNAIQVLEDRELINTAIYQEIKQELLNIQSSKDEIYLIINDEKNINYNVLNIFNMLVNGINANKAATEEKHNKLKQLISELPSCRAKKLLIEKLDEFIIFSTNIDEEFVNYYNLNIEQKFRDTFGIVEPIQTDNDLLQMPTNSKTASVKVSTKLPSASNLSGSTKVSTKLPSASNLSGSTKVSNPPNLSGSNTIAKPGSPLAQLQTVYENAPEKKDLISELTDEEVEQDQPDQPVESVTQIGGIINSLTFIDSSNKNITVKEPVDLLSISKDTVVPKAINCFLDHVKNLQAEIINITLRILKKYKNIIADNDIYAELQISGMIKIKPFNMFLGLYQILKSINKSDDNMENMYTYLTKRLQSDINTCK